MKLFVWSNSSEIGEKAWKWNWKQGLTAMSAISEQAFCGVLNDPFGTTITNFWMFFSDTQTDDF